MSNIEYVIYCRRSSDESSDNQIQSIPDQIKLCKDFADEKWFTIMKKPKDFSDFEDSKQLLNEKNDIDIINKRIYESIKDEFVIRESWSAKKPDAKERPKRHNLMNWIEQWKILWLISYSPDRQARNMLDWWRIIELADDAKVDLQYKTFQFENNASWRMMLWFRFVFSKQYSDKLSEDIWRWNKTTIERWKSMWKYKYWYYRDNEDGFYKPHKKYFPLMKQAFDMTLYQNKSNEQIADWLNANWYLREFKKDNRNSKVSAKRLWDVWKDEFYYWIYINGENIIDLRDWINPYYEAMINQEEHWILMSRRKDKNNYAKPKKRQERYDAIIPYIKWTITTEDGYALSPYIANPKRFEEKLSDLKKKNPKTTLWDIVTSNQIRCKCSSKHSNFKWFEILYSDIEKALVWLFSTIQIKNKHYTNYINFISSELDHQRTQNTEENNRIQLAINRIKWEKTKYISKHLHIKNMDNEENRIYEMTKKQYDDEVNLLRKAIIKLDDSERNIIKEFEIFVKVLQGAPEYFKKASYVQKRKITDLTISNITITAEKQVQLKLRPWLEDIFDAKILNGGGDGSRTRV